MVKANHDAHGNHNAEHILHCAEQDGFIYLGFPFITLTIPVELWDVIKKDLERFIAARTLKQDKKNDSSKKQPEKRS